jgi:hypothetical protein
VDRASTLAGAYAKLDRADEHLEALDAELKTFVKGNMDIARAKFENVDGQLFYVMVVREVRAVPLRIGILLGDAVHNLRAALDHTVWQLVLLRGGKPNSGNQFPIYTYVPSADKWNQRVQGITGSDLALIEHVQPHRRDEPATHPLAVLADVSNTE